MAHTLAIIVFLLLGSAAYAYDNAKAYLVETASPGYTMLLQGPVVAIERLHPDFAERLAAAIYEARENGMPEAGIFSAYRPPIFGIGGFHDTFDSLHAYGLAVDMIGIGSPGSETAKRFHEIAKKHGIACIYGPLNHTEWNHCQAVHIHWVRDIPLRKTITAEGPTDLEVMWKTAGGLLSWLFPAPDREWYAPIKKRKHIHKAKKHKNKSLKHKKKGKRHAS